MVRARKAAVGCALALAVAPRPARAEVGPGHAWQLTHWSTDDGLPQNTVVAIAKDRDGFVWLATQEGLARFDGSRFAVQALPCPSVLSLVAEADGTIAVGTEGCGGFEIVRGEARRVIGVPADARVRALARGADGALLWGTDSGLVATEHGWPHWLFSGDEVTAIVVRPDGATAFATRSRLAELRDGHLRWLPSCIEPSENLWALAAAGDRLWLASRDHGVCALAADGTAVRYGAADGLPSLAIKAVTTAPDGSVWAATLGGVVRFDGARFVPPAVAGAELASASVAFDRDVVWVGGQLNGLSLLRPRRVRTFGPAEGLADEVVWAVAQDRAGTVWVGTESAGIGQLVGDRFVERTPPSFDHDASVGTIVQDPDGSMWFGVSVGLWHLVGDRWERFTMADGLPVSDARAIAFDQAGTMWVGTATGLARRGADGRFVDVTATLGLPRVSYEQVIVDPRVGGLWLGGPDVFGLLVGDRFTPRALDGHPNVSAVTLTDGGVLVGTGNGLARVTAADVRWLRPAQGLVTGQVLAVARRGDDLWITSNRGPYRIAVRELEDFFAGRLARVSPTRYGKRDGMVSAECNTAGPTSLLVATDGRVWIPTVAGLALFEPDTWTDASEPPRAAIDQLDDHHGDLRTAFDRPITLGLGHRDFAVAFSAPEYLSPEALGFRYRLVGYDRDWIEVGDHRTAAYTNLGPGHYRLEVAARLPNSTWGPPATVALLLPAHVYETRWFLVLAVGAAVLAAVGIGYRVTTAARRRERELRARVRERTHELDAALQRTATSEANFRNLLARMPVAVSLARAGAVLYANDEALRIAGAGALAELGGTPFAGPAGDGGDPARASAAGEHRFERGDGSVALADLWYLELVHEGQPAVLCVGHDITRRKQLESMLRTTERMASIGTLAAGVAHEINNPLTYVIANLELVAEELPRVAGGDADLDAVAVAITDAQDGASRVARIVRDLRTFSRPGDDQDGAVALGPVIESTIGICRNEIRHRAELVVDLGDVPPVFGSAHRLGQVLLNILVNAAQAIPDGAAGANRITVATRLRADGRVEVAITDTGCGIPAAHLPHLCDPFFTTKPVGQGTGLGLSIVHGILSRYGGELAIESEVGKGSTFRVLLRPAPVERPGPRPAARSPAAAASEHGTVLVVDDEPLVLQVLQRALEPEHRVETSTRPRDVLDALRTGKRYDCIISDLMMPELDGPELHAAIAAIDPAQAERTLFVSGGSFTERAETFARSLGDRYLTKPIGKAELRAAVAAVLARARERR